MAGLALAWLSLLRIGEARRSWEARLPAAPLIVRGLWAATVACCALTSVMMVCVSMFIVASRGVEASMEASLASRVAIYVGAFGYLTAWLRGRLKIAWPVRGHKGPLLLPPAPCEDPPAPDAEPPPHSVDPSRP